MKRKPYTSFPTLFGVGLFLVTVVTASGQTVNPLQQLFGTISKIGQEISRPSTTASAPSATASQEASSTPSSGEVPGNAASILDALANSSLMMSFSTGCDAAFFQKEEQSALAKIQGGDLAGGGTEAKLNAQEIAVCAVKRQQVPMPIAAQIAGRNLAISAIALHRAGMDTTETLVSAQNALDLLNLDARKNASLIKELKSSGVLPVAPPVAANKAALTMTAAEAASKLMGNNFAFNQNYNGKTLQITGKVQGVSGGKTAFIVLEGVPEKDPSINDQVSCNITNPAFMGAATTISKGQTITVQGIYTVPAQSWLQAGVALQDCHIVQR